MRRPFQRLVYHTAILCTSTGMILNLAGLLKPAQADTYKVFSISGATKAGASISGTVVLDNNGYSEPYFTSAQISVSSPDLETYTTYAGTACGWISGEPDVCSVSLVDQTDSYHFYIFIQGQNGNLFTYGGGPVLPTVGTYNSYLTYPDRTGQSSFITDDIVSGNLSPASCATVCSKPEILFNGSQINGTSNNAVVGEQIALSISNPQDVQSSVWTIAGNTVGGFLPSLKACNAKTPCPAPTDFTNTSTAYYWISAGKNRKVEFAYILLDGTSGSVSTTFDVAAPTVSITSSIGVVSVDENIKIGLGDAAAGIPGISYSYIASTPIGYPGLFEWVQFIDQASATYSTSTASKFCNYGKGLDTEFPYGIQSTEYDAPSFGFIEGYTNIVAVEQFKMYLFWEPLTPNGIPVALGSLTWGWSGSATKDPKSSQWSLDSGATKSVSTFKPGSNYPLWNKVLNTSVKCP